jgi:hypothetical protein
VSLLESFWPSLASDLIPDFSEKNVSVKPSIDINGNFSSTLADSTE